MYIHFTKEERNHSTQVLRKAAEKREDVEYTIDIARALFLADMVYEELRSIGREKLGQVRKIICEPSINEGLIEKTTLEPNPGQESISYNTLAHALDCLDAYETLVPWKQKVDDFRKIKSLDGLL